MVRRKGRLVLLWKALCLMVGTVIFLTVVTVSRADVLGERRVGSAGSGGDTKVSSPPPKTEAIAKQDNRTAAPKTEAIAKQENRAAAAVPSEQEPPRASASPPTRAGGEAELEHWAGGVLRDTKSLPENSAVVAAVKNSPEQVRVRGNEYWKLRSTTGPATPVPRTGPTPTAGPVLRGSPVLSASAGPAKKSGDGGAQEPQAIVEAPAPAAAIAQPPLDPRPRGGAFPRTGALSPQSGAASAAESEVTAKAQGEEIPTAAKDAPSDATAESAESPESTIVQRDLSQEPLSEIAPTDPPVISQPAAELPQETLTLGIALMVAGSSAYFLWTRFTSHLPSVEFWDD